MKLWNTFKSTILLATLTGLLIVTGSALGGQTGMVIAFGLVITLAMLFLVAFGIKAGAIIIFLLLTAPVAAHLLGRGRSANKCRASKICCGRPPGMSPQKSG